MIAYEFRFTFEREGRRSQEVFSVLAGPGPKQELRAAKIAGRRLAEKVGTTIANVAVESRKRAVRGPQRSRR